MPIYILQSMPSALQKSILILLINQRNLITPSRALSTENKTHQLATSSSIKE